MTKETMAEKKPPNGRSERWNEADLKLIESLKRLTKDTDGMPPLSVQRWLPGLRLQLLEDVSNLLDGDKVIFYQWTKEGGEDLGRSCTMSVDNVSEKCRLLETFFEIKRHKD